MEIYELVPEDGKWHIRAEGFPRSLGIYDTKADGLVGAELLMSRLIAALRIYDSARNLEEELVHRPSQGLQKVTPKRFTETPEIAGENSSDTPEPACKSDKSPQ